MKARICVTTTSINSVRIISIRPKLQATNASFLQPCFSKSRSIFVSNNIKPKIEAIVPLSLLKTNWKIFFSKFSKTLSYLSQAFGLKLSKFLIQIRGSITYGFPLATSQIYLCNIWLIVCFHQGHIVLIFFQKFSAIH